MDMQLSALDQQRFGPVTAKATLAADDSAAAVQDWCRAHAVHLLIARLPTAAMALTQALEAAGARLADTLVYYTRKRLDGSAPALPAGYRWRLATPADADAVERLAGLTFAGYAGHYHADARLDRAAADAVYADWAANSCRSAAVADAVIVLEDESGLAAFATLKDRGQGVFEGVLFGVHPQHQGRGLYNGLMQLAQHWAAARGFGQMLVSTQVTNLSVQKVWCRLGFEPSASYYTLHQWFD